MGLQGHSSPVIKVLLAWFHWLEAYNISKAQQRYEQQWKIHFRSLDLYRIKVLDNLHPKALVTIWIEISGGLQSKGTGCKLRASSSGQHHPQSAHTLCKCRKWGWRDDSSGGRVLAVQTGGLHFASQSSLKRGSGCTDLWSQCSYEKIGGRNRRILRNLRPT